METVLFSQGTSHLEIGRNNIVSLPSDVPAPTDGVLGGYGQPHFIHIQSLVPSSSQVVSRAKCVHAFFPMILSNDRFCSLLISKSCQSGPIDCGHCAAMTRNRYASSFSRTLVSPSSV